MHSIPFVSGHLRLNYSELGMCRRFVKTEISFTNPIQRDKAPSTSPQYFWGTKALNQSFSSVYSLYANFVGAPHFHVIAKLLGYQGIAVVIEELLKIVKTLVSTAHFSCTITCADRCSFSQLMIDKIFSCNKSST